MELSIVLVILGLLVGGVLTGQSLIRAAEMRSVTTDYGRYVTAIQTFRDKYFALPGDMSNATKYWGTATNCPGNYSQGSTTATTCDGDGDGKVMTATASSELFRIWQHLANAGLIEGSYTGVPGDSSNYWWMTAPSNSPRSKLGSGVIWSVANYNNTSGGLTSTIFYYDLGNFMMLGQSTPSGPNATPVVSPQDAYNVDVKIDDGKPGRGKVTTNVGSNCNSAASGTDYDATYSLTLTAKNCFIVFPQMF